MSYQFNKYTVIVSFALVAGCGVSKYHGYIITSNQYHPSSGTSLLLHAVNNFPIKISSIDGQQLHNTIKTSAKKPTYIELEAGIHTLGVSLTQGSGQCGNVMITAEQPVKLSYNFKKDKVYLLQRKSLFDPGLMCDIYKNKIQVEYYIEEIPALPYEDVRKTFEVINLNSNH